MASNSGSLLVKLFYILTKAYISFLQYQQYKYCSFAKEWQTNFKMKTYVWNTDIACKANSISVKGEGSRHVLFPASSSLELCGGFVCLGNAVRAAKDKQNTVSVQQMSAIIQ